MDYLIIYKNQRGKFYKRIKLNFYPQVGNFITVNNFLYRIDYIEIDYNIDTILYCSEVRDFQNKPKKHWLEDVYKIEEE
jgi:hypothetical protein